MENPFEVTFVNQNEYMIRASPEGQTVESLFRLDPDFLEEIGLENFEKLRVVEETLQFMAEHQPVADFPPLVDLEDIAAAYGDYIPQLRQRLQADRGK